MNKTRLASLADSLSVKVMLLFLVFQVAFVLSNTAANCLPRPVIESHAQGSESSALLTDMYVYDHRVAAGPVCFDNNRFVIEVARQKDRGSPFKTMAVAEIDDVTKANGITHQQYYRYWHGRARRSKGRQRAARIPVGRCRRLGRSTETCGIWRSQRPPPGAALRWRYFCLLCCPSDYFPARALYEPKCDVIIFRVCLGPLFHTLYKPSPTRSLAYAQ